MQEKKRFFFFCGKTDSHEMAVNFLLLCLGQKLHISWLEICGFFISNRRFCSFNDDCQFADHWYNFSPLIFQHSSSSCNKGKDMKRLRHAETNFFLGIQFVYSLWILMQEYTVTSEWMYTDLIRISSVVLQFFTKLHSSSRCMPRFSLLTPLINLALGLVSWVVSFDTVP
jgi:hypothetical protein